MIERLKSQFKSKNYYSIQINIQGIYLYYTAVNSTINIVLIWDSPEGNEWTVSQYNNIIRQVKNMFREKGYLDIRLINLIVTSYTERVREFCEGWDCHWIIDISEYKLIIYENQDSEFLFLKEDIEEVIINYYYNIDGGYRKGKGSFWEENFSLCNSIIIIINLAAYLFVEFTGYSGDSQHMINCGAMYWPYIQENGEYYRLLTCMFLHFGIEHLFNNMLVLTFLGNKIERTMGKVKYLIIYFASGILASLTSMYYNMYNENNVVSAGASGAIYGLIGAVLCMAIFDRKAIDSIGKRRTILLVALSLYYGFTSQNTDNAAHIGGFIAGILLCLVLFGKKWSKIDNETEVR